MLSWKAKRVFICFGTDVIKVRLKTRQLMHFGSCTHIHAPMQDSFKSELPKVSTETATMSQNNVLVAITASREKEEIMYRVECASDLKVDRVMIVTNTRYSEHASRYGKCRNILQIGWSSPINFSLQNMIEEKTCIR